MNLGISKTEKYEPSIQEKYENEKWFQSDEKSVKTKQDRFFIYGFPRTKNQRI